MEATQRVRPMLVMTMKQVIKNLEKIKNCPAKKLFDAVENAYNGYSYEGEDELIGEEKWPDLNVDDSYELEIKLDHEDAYEMTIHVVSKDQHITVTNVL